MATSFSAVATQIHTIDFGTVDIDPQEFANILQKYIVQGSQRYTLSRDDIHVYANPTWAFTDKDETDIKTIKGKTVANNLKGLMAAGSRFLDSVIFLSLDDDKKPEPDDHPIPKDPNNPPTFGVYNNHSEIAKCMFFSFFYLLTRARAPGKSGDTNSQVVPSFLKTVLSISKQPHEVADYLSSFDLNQIDPSWIQHIKIGNLGREALNRFGLGVAGYRLTSPFKLKTPDKPGWEKYKEAVEVAKSFATEPACWNFHPATRSPDLLTKYGNINKNLGNLLLLVYTGDTLAILEKSRTIFQIPTHEPAYTNYETWKAAMKYQCQVSIFTT